MPEGKISPALILVPALGLGIVGVLGIAYLARAAGPEPEPEPGTGVTVALKHPPPEATMWSLSLVDWDITAIIDFVGHNGQSRLDIAETATFEIPEGFGFPLRVGALQLTRWNEAGTALQQIYYVQSFRPYLYDWDLEEYGTEPDPTYREAFIPDQGSYLFNTATGLFEPVGIAKTLELQAAP